MGILAVISGANSSGKSRFAEQLIAQTTGDRCYIATMHPHTEENLRRIEKHRAQRRGLRFRTLECPYTLEDAELSPESVVLLEDVSNLLGNVIFEKGGSADEVYDDILAQSERCKLLVAVTIAGLSAEGYDGETADYINALNTLNQKLLSRATVAVTMAEGQPIIQKGDLHDLL